MGGHSIIIQGDGNIDIMASGNINKHHHRRTSSSSASGIINANNATSDLQPPSSLHNSSIRFKSEAANNYYYAMKLQRQKAEAVQEEEIQRAAAEKINKIVEAVDANMAEQSTDDNNNDTDKYYSYTETSNASGDMKGITIVNTQRMSPCSSVASSKVEEDDEQQQQQHPNKIIMTEEECATSGRMYRDIITSILDMIGDWSYIFFLNMYSDGIRHRVQYMQKVRMLSTVAIFGSILSIWLIATTIARARRYRSLCCKCTVPRLSMYLVLFHHIPVCLLTAYLELEFRGEMSIVGCVNIVTTLVAFMNAFVTTKWFERCFGGYCCRKVDAKIGQCGDGYEAEMITKCGAENKLCTDAATVGSSDNSDDSIVTEYKEMV